MFSFFPRLDGEDSSCSILVKTQISSLLNTILQLYYDLPEMADLPYATVRRIMKNAGAKRVSKDAVYELMRLMELYAEKVASTSVSIAENAGSRTTVMKDDVRISAEEIHGVISL